MEFLAFSNTFGDGESWRRRRAERRPRSNRRSRERALVEPVRERRSCDMVLPAETHDPSLQRVDKLPLNSYGRRRVNREEPSPRVAAHGEEITRTQALV